MSHQRYKRKHLYVDAEVQGTIVRRVIAYWGICVVFITLPILTVMTLMDPSRFFYEHAAPMFLRLWPAYLCMTLLLPLVIRDVLKISNRFCGPIYRLQKELDRCNEGGDFRPIYFREGDFWIPVSEALNRFVAERQLESSRNEAAEEQAAEEQAAEEQAAEEQTAI